MNTTAKTQNPRCRERDILIFSSFDLINAAHLTDISDIWLVRFDKCFI